MHYALLIGLRYSVSPKRNRYTGVIATVSLLGMVLGVASLITVLSVMNGFGTELRDRVLALVPHGYVSAGAEGINDWQSMARELEQATGVVAVAPFSREKVLLSAANGLRGGVLTAIEPQSEARVSQLAESMVLGSSALLDEKPFTVVMGTGLARALDVMPGDDVTVTVPRLTVTPLGVFPRSKRLQLVGLFEVGAQLDSYQAYVSLATGQRLFGEPGRVQGLRVRTVGVLEAPAVLSKMATLLPERLVVSDWTTSQGSLFQAVRMEKAMVALLLLSVVAVAAFNIVSTLALAVAEKRRDIAVLRTLGAGAAGIMGVFMVSGMTIALAGVTGGAVLGVILATNISAIVAFLEGLFGARIFDPNVYFISELPSVLLWQDVVGVVAAALLLSLLAAVYPAWRASRVAPAEALRYD